MFTVAAAIPIPLSLFSFKIFKMLKMRTLYILGGIINAIGFYIMSISTTVTVLYIGAFIMGFGVFANGYLTGGALLTQWFDKNRGLVMGIIGAAAGVGSLVFSPIIASIIDSQGYQFALLVSAIIVGVSVTFSGIFLIKDKPSDYGLKAYGQSLDQNFGDQSFAAKPGANIPGLSLAEAKKLPLFYFVIVCGFMITTLGQGVSTQQSAMIMDKGFTLVQASYALSIYSLANTLNKILSGVIIDKFGLKALISYCGVGLVAACLIIMFATSYPAMIAFAILACLWSAMSVSFTIMANTFLFERKEIGAIQGFTQVAQSLGAMTGPILAGLCFSIKGTYSLWLVITIVAVVALIGIVFYVLQDKNSYVNTSKKA